MASIKIVLLKKKKEDLDHALTLRIIKDRKPGYIYLGHRLKETDWDEKAQRVKSSHPNHKRLNNLLLKKLSEATDNALELETQKKDISTKVIKQKIKPSGGATFFPQAETWLNELKTAGKYNQYVAEKPRLKHFKQFLGADDIAFGDITVGLLEKFKNYLKGAQKVKERTAVNHLVTIRSVFSYAIKNNVTDPKFYPFGKGKTKIKYPESKKVGLTSEEITKLEKVELTDEYENHCRNLFLVSFYFAGMRISDELRLKHSDFVDSRLHYTMGKNNKAVSLKVPDKAGAILQNYPKTNETKHDLIFPELQRLDNLEEPFLVQRAIAFAVNRIDKCMRKEVAPKAGIDKKLTMHIARHSFAQNATSIDVRVLQRLFRHTKLETTEGYMGQFIHQEADNALDAVLKF